MRAVTSQHAALTGVASAIIGAAIAVFIALT